MAYLINRKAPSRIECLHSLLKFLYQNFNFASFTLEDCMFSRDEDNIHSYCSLIEDTEFGYKCPFKESPLSDAGCYITNGKEEDTTKKKEVSNTINALHGMRLLKRVNHDIVITELGAQFAQSELFELSTAALIKNAILSYGPIIGVIDEIENVANHNIFNASDINVGYPVTEETVEENGVYITISSGSTTDANTRSRSCYLSWLVTAGIIEPIGVAEDCNSDIPYERYRTFLNADTLKARKYRLVVNPLELYNHIKITQCPLDYINLTKLTRALRENGQNLVRETTMKYENRIQNRRFAIIYLLNKAYTDDSYVDFTKLYRFMIQHRDVFVISDNNFRDVLLEELHIANVAGIPFRSVAHSADIKLYPKLGVNLEELCKGVNRELIGLLETF